MILLYLSKPPGLHQHCKEDRLPGNRKVTSCKLPVGVVPDRPYAGSNLQLCLKNL